MKTLSKILAALLALSLLFAAGCAKNEPSNTPDPASPTVSPAGTTSVRSNHSLILVDVPLTVSVTLYIPLM